MIFVQVQDMSSLDSGFAVALSTAPVDDTPQIHPVQPNQQNQSVQPDQPDQPVPTDPPAQVDMNDDYLFGPQDLIEQLNVPPISNDNATAAITAPAIDGNANVNATGSNGIYKLKTMMNILKL